MTLSLTMIEALHEKSGCLVRRPEGNKALVQPEADETVDSILGGIQDALDQIGPVLVNCSPLGSGPNIYCVAFIEVTPVPKGKKEELLQKICGYKHLKFPEGNINMNELSPFRLALQRKFELEKVIPAHPTQATAVA